MESVKVRGLMFPSYKESNVCDLLPYINNARTHSAEQVAQIAASIKEFGFTNPVLTDGKNGVIAGHGRLLAARKMGMDTVPVIELAHLSNAQRKAYILADNKLALNAGWNDDLLGIELGELRDDGFALELTGFSEFEIAGALREFEPAPDDGGSRLDQKKQIQCPECGHEFTP